MNGDQTVTATFIASPPSQFTLAVTNPGHGTVTSSPAGIDCGASCSASFPSGQAVTLTAVAESGYQFSGWSGAGCSGTDTCTVTMDDARSVTAAFAAVPPGQYALTVVNGGNGKVTSAPAGIDCGATCSSAFDSGASVTLTASPDSGYQFTGWSGACTNAAGDCIVEMNDPKEVTANFAPVPPPNQYLLTITNPVHGRVSSEPTGIDCGVDCGRFFPSGQTVTLTASPDAGYQFSGWSGACTETSGTCTVVMNAAKNVTATFTVIPPPSEYTLTVTHGGHGKVTSAPSGIDCGATCSFSFASGQAVTLTATPDSGYQFSGWTGACTNTSVGCSLEMNAAKNVSATFTPIPPPNQFTLTVSNGGHGSITSSPAGIACGTICSTSFDQGRSVTLTATPDSGYQFSGWSGACTNASGACTLTMSEARNVGAAFTVIPPGNEYTLTVTNGGHGTVISDPAGIACGTTCSFSFSAGQSVTLSAKADQGWRFSGWSGACSGSGPCTVDISETRNVTASFVLPPRRDFNGDGYGDLLWRDHRTGLGKLWLMVDGKVSAEKDVPRKGKSWLLAATGDFDGDLQPDILWRHRATGQNQIWLMKGSKVKSEAVLPDQVTAFGEVRTGDFDGDGKTDILWHNPITSETRLWLMDGTAFKSAVALPSAPPGSGLAAAADFNGDGRPDVWWYNASTGQNTLWLMAGITVQSTEIPPTQTSEWMFGGTGLFDDDNRADVLWRNRVTRENQIWLMDGGNRTSVVGLPSLPRAWYPASIDDFDGNGMPDVLWSNRKNGKIRLWIMDGTSVHSRAAIEGNGKGWSTPSH